MKTRRKGLAAVAGVMGILAMTITALYLIAYVNVQNRLAASARQEAQVAQAPRVPEMVGVYVYNASVCSLLKGNLTQQRMPWKLLVVNTGNIPVEVDSIVFSVDTLMLLQDNSKRTLLPGQYVVQPLLDCGPFCGLYMTIGTAQVHTSRGGFFVGGYGVPKPETIISIDENGRCLEP
ncbi:MAG: hypothetical protein QXD47_08770 [Candidatus Caldarchaeum sp.]